MEEVTPKVLNAWLALSAEEAAKLADSLESQFSLDDLYSVSCVCMTYAGNFGKVYEVRSDDTHTHIHIHITTHYGCVVRVATTRN